MLKDPKEAHLCSNQSLSYGCKPHLRASHPLLALYKQDDMVQAVESLGFEVKLLGSGDASSLRLQIGGMTCSSCSTAIETTLTHMPGMNKASVSLMTHGAEVRRFPLPYCVLRGSQWFSRKQTSEIAWFSAFLRPDGKFAGVQIEYDSAILGGRDIIAAVRGMGYTASLLEADDMSAGMEVRAKERRFWRSMVLASLVFSVPVFLLAMVFSYIPSIKDGLNSNVGGFTVNEIVQWILTTPVQVRLPVCFEFCTFTASKIPTSWCISSCHLL